MHWNAWVWVVAYSPQHKDPTSVHVAEAESGVGIRVVSLSVYRGGNAT